MINGEVYTYMTVEQLTYFLAAAKYLNFSKAASALFIHPTTMSRAILKLEDEIGAPLFVRMKYSLQLSDVGHVLMQEASPVVAGWEKMYQRVRSAAAGVTGSLTLMGPHLYFQIIAPAYGRFASKYPKIGFSIDVCPYSKMDSVYHSISDGDCDLGISFSHNVPDDPAVGRIPLMREKLCLTVPVDHPFAGRGTVSIDDLCGERVLVGEHIGQSLLGELRSKLGREALESAQSSSGEVMLMRFTAGFGIMFMPSTVANHNCGGFSVLEVDGLDTDFDVLLLWRHDNNNPSLPLFLDEMEGARAGLFPVRASQ
jgi:DNA-binding transcriptional LysR family regulator